MIKKIFYILPLLAFLACKNDNDDDMSSSYKEEDDLIKLTDLDSDLNESSALLYDNGILWTHNDSGDEAKIYSVPEDAPDIDEKVNITNALHIDWEDLAQDQAHIYIGDFGNNSGERQNLVIYKIPKSVLPEDTDAELIRFIYSDQSTFDNQNAMHDFDCESMVEVDGNLYVFSKNHVDKKTKVYEIPKTAGTHIAQKIDEFNTDGLITGADFDNSSRTLALVGYNIVDDILYPFVWIFYDFSGVDFFDGKSTRVNLPVQTQTEGITYKENGRYLISSENENGTDASIYLFNAEKWKE